MATSCEELTHWKRLWCWEGLGAGGEGDDRGWDGWMASLTRWMWVWVNSRSWWWTGRPGMLQFMGSQRVGYHWVTELNWTELTHFNHLMTYFNLITSVKLCNLFFVVLCFLLIYAFPLWFITGCWIQFPMLYCRTLLFILPTYKHLHLLTHPLTPSPQPSSVATTVYSLCLWVKVSSLNTLLFPTF